MELIIDLETTGLDPQEHHIVEVCIVDLEGRILFAKRYGLKGITLTKSMEAGLEYNKLTYESLKDLTPFSTNSTEVTQILAKADKVWAYNASFEKSWLGGDNWACAMELYCGKGPRKKLPSFVYGDRPHNAYFDCLNIVELLQRYRRPELTWNLHLLSEN